MRICPFGVVHIALLRHLLVRGCVVRFSFYSRFYTITVSSRAKHSIRNHSTLRPREVGAPWGAGPFCSYVRFYRISL